MQITQAHTKINNLIVNIFCVKEIESIINNLSERKETELIHTENRLKITKRQGVRESKMVREK